MPFFTDIYKSKLSYHRNDIKKPDNIKIENRFDHKRVVKDGYYHYWDDNSGRFAKDSLITCLSHAIQQFDICKRDDLGKYIVDGVLDKIKIDFDNIVKLLNDNRYLSEDQSLYNYMIRYPKFIDDVDANNEVKEVIPEGFSVIIDICYALLFTGEAKAYGIVNSFVDRISKIECVESELQQCFINEILYVVSKASDYYLFTEGNFKMAMNGYAMIYSLYKRCNIVSCCKDGRNFTEQYSEMLDGFELMIESYDIWHAVLFSIRNHDLKHIQDNGYIRFILETEIPAECYKLFNNYMKINEDLAEAPGDKTHNSYIDTGSKLWRITNEYYQHLYNNKDKELKIDNLRIELIVYYTLLYDSLKYGVLLYDEIKFDINEFAQTYKELDCFRTLSLAEYDSIEEYVEKKCYNNFELFTSIFWSAIYVGHLQHILGLPSLPDRLGYYTTLSTLEYLLPISANEPNYALRKMGITGLSNSVNNMIGRYSIMNVGHMNDPQEGKVLLYTLLDDNYKPDNRSGLHNQYVFLKSFTTRIDDLPMWEMYGGNAKGCCIELDMERIRREGDYKLVRVCYIRRDVDGNSNKWSVQEKDNEELKGYVSTIDDYLKQLSRYCKNIIQLDEQTGFDRVVGLLNPILYLFKSSTYCHENEYRIIESTNVDDARICYTKERDGGRLYIPSEQRTYIKEIILGPKFESVEDTLPYLQYRCHYLKDELKMTNDIVIRVSENEYI